MTTTSARVCRAPGLVSAGPFGCNGGSGAQTLIQTSIWERAMQILYLLLLLLGALVAAVAVWNWDVFSASTDLWLGFGTVSIPLGVTLLALLVLVTVLFLVHAVYTQGSALLEARRHTKEMQANRDLADKAEASRFTALREYIADEFSRQAARHASAQKEIIDRIVIMERTSQTYSEQATNSLAATLGELEDRLERHLPDERGERSLPPPLR